MGKLVFACATPHPPILIPDIGKEMLGHVAASQQALEELGRRYQACHTATPIDTTLIISPHASPQRDRIPIYTATKHQGDFARFGAPHVQMTLPGDPELGDTLATAATQNGTPVTTLAEPLALDWGIMVPLYYLYQQGPATPVLPLSFAFLNLQDLFSFGKTLAAVIAASPKNVAIVASGDLSHRLIPDAPAGYHPSGKKFDKRFVELLNKNQVEEILSLEPTFVDEAGECGLRSFAILLGALADKKITPEVVSHEGPFGVGYLVAHFRID